MDSLNPKKMSSELGSQGESGDKVYLWFRRFLGTDAFYKQFANKAEGISAIKQEWAQYLGSMAENIPNDLPAQTCRDILSYINKLHSLDIIVVQFEPGFAGQGLYGQPYIAMLVGQHIYDTFKANFEDDESLAIYMCDASGEKKLIVEAAKQYPGQYLAEPARKRIKVAVDPIQEYYVMQCVRFPIIELSMLAPKAASEIIDKYIFIQISYINPGPFWTKILLPLISCFGL